MKQEGSKWIYQGIYIRNAFIIAQWIFPKVNLLLKYVQLISYHPKIASRRINSNFWDDL